MSKLQRWRANTRIALCATIVTLGLDSTRATDLDPKAITIQLPNQLKWVESPDGSATAVVRGDPNEPGEYILLIKWHPHHMSHPHFHPNDRYVTVISGTWWVGTGAKYDPDGTVPVPAGSFVRHAAKQVHYDGAKDQEAMLEIVGDGPATMIPAEKE
jgi:hypothetical protein